MSSAIASAIATPQFFLLYDATTDIYNGSGDYSPGSYTDLKTQEEDDSVSVLRDLGKTLFWTVSGTPIPDGTPGVIDCDYRLVTSIDTGISFWVPLGTRAKASNYAEASGVTLASAVVRTVAVVSNDAV